MSESEETEIEIEIDVEIEIEVEGHQEFQVDLSRYFNMVHRMAKRWVSPLEPVRDSDVFAEGLLALVRAKQKYNPRLGVDFSSYAWSSVRNTVRQYGLRRRRLNSKFKQGEPEHFETGAVDIAVIDDIVGTLIHNEDINLLKSVLDSFENKVREVFFLRLEGRTFREIAEIIGTTKQNINLTYWQRIIKPALMEAFGVEVCNEEK